MIAPLPYVLDDGHIIAYLVSLYNTPVLLFICQEGWNINAAKGRHGKHKSVHTFYNLLRPVKTVYWSKALVCFIMCEDASYGFGAYLKNDIKKIIAQSFLI